MPKSKPITKEECLRAMRHTKSVRSASRYLNCSYQHLKPIMKMYEATEDGYDNLFEQHKNQQGKGIKKFLGNGTKLPPLVEIIEGRVDPSSFNPEKIKYNLLTEGYLKEECYKCGFNERRVMDYKMPLLLHFKNGNKKHYVLDNLEMLCYNCYYLRVADVFTNKQVENIEDHKSINQGSVDWELSDYQTEQLEKLGLGDVDDDGEFDIISSL
tara:strand:+ start:1079 stop:1714 length:636 start_codon:yes stop_codon:yes gene_type:complete